MLLRVWRLLTPFHTVFYVLLGLALIYEAFQVALSYLVSFVLSLTKLDLSTYGWIAALGGLYVFYHLFMILDTQFDWHIIRRIVFRCYDFLKMRSISKLLRMTTTWMHDHNSGSIVGEYADGIWKIDGLIGMFCWEIVQTIGQSSLSLIVMCVVSPILVPPMLVAMALFVVITLLGERARLPFRKQRQKLFSKDWEDFAKAAQGHTTIKMFGQEERIIRDHQKLQNELVDVGSEEVRLAIFKYNAQRIIVLSIIRVVCYWLLKDMLLGGQIDEGGFIFIAILFERMLGNLWRFARLTDRVIADSERITTLLDLLDEKEIIDQGTVILPDGIPVGVTFKGVCYTHDSVGEYQEETGHLHNIDLEVKPGQTVAIVGPTGSGKSTLLNLITMLTMPSKGEVLIGGVSTCNLSGHNLRKKIAVVPQDVFLISGTVFDNIAFSRPDASIEEVTEVTRAAGLLDEILALKDGFNSVVGERGVKFSGGQRQRLAIARALLVKGALIRILDEPTSAVDSRKERLIQEELDILARKKNVTTFIIAHRLSTIMHADLIVVLDDGKVVEQGTHGELMSKNGLYSELVTLQKM